MSLIPGAAGHAITFLQAARALLDTVASIGGARCEREAGRKAENGGNGHAGCDF